MPDSLDKQGEGTYYSGQAFSKRREYRRSFPATSVHSLCLQTRHSNLIGFEKTNLVEFGKR
jgi:hypothetical protein